jgi:hypothetical protein
MVIIEVRAGEGAQEQVDEYSLQYHRQGCGLSTIEMVIIEVRAGEGAQEQVEENGSQKEHPTQDGTLHRFKGHHLRTREKVTSSHRKNNIENDGHKTEEIK